MNFCGFDLAARQKSRAAGGRRRIEMKSHYEFSCKHFHSYSLIASPPLNGFGWWIRRGGRERVMRNAIHFGGDATAYSAEFFLCQNCAICQRMEGGIGGWRKGNE